MAEPKQVELLKTGIERWNQWRREHPDSRPDLRDAGLHRTHLCGANLSHTDLSHANLSYADLSHADLSGACLIGADLRHADLSNAHLIRTDLNNANLSNVYLIRTDLSDARLSATDLSHAHLIHADLSSADLSGANLSGAYLLETSFGNTNLNRANRLETCIYLGPSTLDGRTLAQSGPLPLEFLRGCGLSAWEIETTKLYQAKLTNEQLTDLLYRIHELRGTEPIQLYSCFISYSSEDEGFSRKLHDRMQEAGIRTWFAPEDMRWGDPIINQLDQALKRFDKLLLVLTETSMKSKWVERELRSAMKREQDEQRRILFPIALVDFEAIEAWRIPDHRTGDDLAEQVRALYIPDDFRRWEDDAAFERAFDKLKDHLRRDA